MNPLLLNHFIGFSLIAAILPSISALVYFNRPKNILNRVFALYLLAIAWWAFFTIFMIFSPSPEWGLFWDRMCLIGVAFIPSTLFHFISAYTKDNVRLKPLVRANYLISVFFLVILWFTDLFVAGVKPKFGLKYFTVPGPFYIFYVAFFVLTVVLAMYFLFRFSKKATHAKIRTQATFLFWFSIVGYTGGSCNYLLVYDLSLPGVAQTSNYGVMILSISIAYIIFRYRFLDIEVIVKKTLVFAGLFGIVMAVVGTISVLTQNVLSNYVDIPPFVSAAFSVAIALFLFDPARKLLVSVTDRFLFQKKENMKTILRRLSERIITILDLDRVGDQVLLTLKDAMRLKSGAILLKDEESGQYRLLNSFDLKVNSLVLSKEEIFIRYIREHSEVLNLQDPDVREHLPVPFLAVASQLKAILIVPLFLHKDLIGILALGEKKSDEEFTKEELDYFPTVAGQVAIALSNARLYDILKKSQIDFAQQTKMAAIGTLSAGISHEVKNPLNIVRSGLELFRFNKKMGIFDKMTKEELEKTVLEVTEKGIAAVDRATGVIDRLSSFAKKPKEIKIEPVNVETCLDVTFSLLAKEYENNNVEFEKRLARDLPKILADQVQLEEIFLNLLVNARHAIGEKGKVTVEAIVHPDTVEILVKDTGHGIAKEVLDKIFDPFFTTKDTSRNPDPNQVTGSGLGLFLVREFIRRFGGTITAESEVGKGTTFHLLLQRADKKKAEIFHG